MSQNRYWNNFQIPVQLTDHQRAYQKNPNHREMDQNCYSCCYYSFYSALISFLSSFTSESAFSCTLLLRSPVCPECLGQRDRERKRFRSERERGSSTKVVCSSQFFAEGRKVLKELGILQLILIL
jgi:hypothetical protein